MKGPIQTHAHACESVIAMEDVYVLPAHVPPHMETERALPGIIYDFKSRTVRTQGRRELNVSVKDTGHSYAVHITDGAGRSAWWHFSGDEAQEKEAVQFARAKALIRFTEDDLAGFWAPKP